MSNVSKPHSKADEIADRWERTLLSDAQAADLLYVYAASLEEQYEDVQRKLSCGYDTGTGTNCGECLDCLKVNWHFAQKALTGLKEQVEALTGRNQFLSTEQVRADVAEAALSELKEQLEAAMDCMNYAWTIICNASEGDWTKQQQEWQDAAARCREQYHALLASNPASGPDA